MIDGTDIPSALSLVPYQQWASRVLMHIQFVPSPLNDIESLSTSSEAFRSLAWSDVATWMPERGRASYNRDHDPGRLDIHSYSRGWAIDLFDSACGEPDCCAPDYHQGIVRLVNLRPISAMP
jgi:hypothetical protein